MGKEDKQIARLLKIMREQGKKDNPETLVIGTMSSAKSCTVGELELDAEDLLVAEHLVTDGSRLKKGDTVVLMKLEEQDTYVILSKVVEL